ncbi:MAG: T9SS type A sorting domain-containing protein, partial [Saprospiraceae bacterium]
KSWTRDALIADNGTRVTSLVEKPGSPETIYMLLYEPNTKMTTLVRSDNYGQSWYYLINSGWFTIPSEDAGKIDVWGGRLAVTPADPNRIYMVLNGFSQPDANLQLDGFIGIYQSNDGGFNWARKTGPIGRPYDVNTKPNLMSFTWPPYEYNQVDYLNNAIAVSTLDPDHLYVGSLAMWESTNAGTSWTVRGGYGGNIPYIHPDIRRMQFRKTSSTTEELYWVSDGGVNFTPDGQLANHEARNNGLFSNHFWGFDSDIREQLMGGGSYHNGNNFYSGAYPNGSWKHAGGAESATGYMQYGENHRAWFTEYSIYAQNVAPGINQTNSAYPTILDQGVWRPNQPRGYEYSRASRVLFDRKNPHVIYWGALGKFCKSTDDGQTATVLVNFGDENMVQWMEQSVEDPNVIYIQVEETATNQFKLYRTANGGESWSLAAGPNTSNMHFATLGDSYIYRADQNGPNGQKVFYSTNGGVTWNNITTPTLDGLTIRAVLCMENVVNDFFIATNGGGVFNYNYYTQDWDNISEGLNPGSNPVRLAVNYKTQKLQLATRGMGVWERDFVGNPVSLGIKVASDYAGKLCAGEAVHFFYRGQSSANATYSWTFPGGTPGTSSAENPTVSYAEGGTYPVMLTVTDNTYGLSQSVSLTEYVTIVSTSALPYAETFESGDFHPDWQFEDLNENGNTWQLENGVGGFGNSQVTMFNDNYNTNEQGTRNIAQTIKVDLSTATQASLNFDLAYTGYSGDPTFRDSLEVMCSVDCGKTFTRVFFDGGEGLHTAAPISGAFTPTADQWETKTVDLANFLGNDEVLFAFHNIGYYGNNMYIDNINVQGTVVSSEEEAVAQSLLVYPNPSDGNFKIRFDFSESVDGLVRLIDPLGRVVYESSIQSNGGIYEQQVNVPDLSTGLYLLSIKSPNVDISHKIYVQK